MTARLLLVLGIGLSLAAEAFADDGVKKELAEAVKQLNDAFAKRDAAAIDKLMAADHVAVLSVGVRQTKAESLKSLKDYDIKTYDTEGVRVTMLGDGAALLTFREVIRGTFQGKAIPLNNYASAVWAKKDGKWVEVYYQQTAAEKE